MTERYTVAVADDEITIGDDQETLFIAATETIVDLVGGETYTLEYDDRQSQAAWLGTDPDGTITVQVREALDGMPFPPQFLAALYERDTDGDPSQRAQFFAETVTTIWDAKGNPDEEELPDAMVDDQS
jgi:hypothetical protein